MIVFEYVFIHTQGVASEKRRLYMQRYRRRERNNWTRAEIRKVCGLNLQPGNSGLLWQQLGKYFPYFTNNDDAPGAEDWGGGHHRFQD